MSGEKTLKAAKWHYAELVRGVLEATVGDEVEFPKSSMLIYKDPSFQPETIDLSRQRWPEVVVIRETMEHMPTRYTNLVNTDEILMININVVVEKITFMRKLYLANELAGSYLWFEDLGIQESVNTILKKAKFDD